MAKNKTRRNKSRSRKSVCKKAVGGKRKTHKAHKGPSDWNKHVMRIYHEMKKSNPETKLGDAMKHAAALKKKGQL